MNERKIEALRNMALRGTKHEAEQAKAILERMNIEIQEEEPLEYFTFSFSNKYERSLFAQTASMVFDSVEPPIYMRKGMSRNKRLIRCTKGQYEELKLIWESYTRALDDELAITVSAFIQKNRIFCHESMSSEPRELTEKDRKMLNRADSVDRVTIRKQVTARASA